MLKPFFGIDARQAAAVQKCGLPGNVVLQEFDIAGGDLAAESGRWDLAYNGADSGSAGNFCLGFILEKPAGDLVELMGQIENLLPEYLRQDGIFLVSAKTEKLLPAWCWRRLCLMSGHLLQEYARSQLALAKFRTRAQQLETSLALAEAAFVDFRKEPLKLALRLEPAGVYVRPSSQMDTAAKITVRQKIPVLIANIIYLDLFFSRDGAALTGQAHLTVTAAYSGKIICDQHFAFAEIQQGWKRFFCSMDDIATKQPLIIDLELSSAVPADLLPGLSNPSPIPEDCAFVACAGPAGRPLAVQIWSGIAGIRYPRHVNALAPAHKTDIRDREMISVPNDVLAGAVPYLISRKDLEFAPISYENETQSLLVHPLGRVPTVAKLAALQVVNLKSVSALVQLRRFDGYPVDFAIMVAGTAGRQPRFEDIKERDERGFETLNWLHLHAGEWGDAHCALPETMTGSVDIYLITRNQSDDYHYSWAFFRGLQLECET